MSSEESCEDEADELSGDQTISDILSEDDSLVDIEASVPRRDSEKAIFYYGKNGIKWSKKSSHSTPGEFDHSRHCLNDSATKIQSAKDAFQLFFPDNLISLMVKYTNMYARRRHNRGRSKWKDVSVPEMKAFIGVLIAAGRMHQNNLNSKLLWADDSVWAPQFYKLAMSRNRFSEIFINWRFDDRSTRSRRFKASQDKLEPVKMFYETVVDRCIKVYNPGKNLTVDERLCTYRGKVSDFLAKYQMMNYKITFVHQNLLSIFTEVLCKARVSLVIQHCAFSNEFIKTAEILQENVCAYNNCLQNIIK